MAASLVELSRVHIASDAVVWLFGSRVRDEARGGDIDVMIEAPGIDNPLERKIDFRLAFEDRWGEQLKKKQQTQQALLGLACAGLLVAIIQSFPCFQGGVLYLGPA